MPGVCNGSRAHSGRDGILEQFHFESARCLHSRHPRNWFCMVFLRTFSDIRLELSLSLDTLHKVSVKKNGKNFFSCQILSVVLYKNKIRYISYICRAFSSFRLGEPLCDNGLVKKRAFWGPYRQSRINQYLKVLPAPYRFFGCFWQNTDITLSQGGTYVSAE